MAIRVGLKVKAANTEVKPEVKEEIKPVEDFKPEVEIKTDDKKAKGKKAAK